MRINVINLRTSPEVVQIDGLSSEDSAVAEQQLRELLESEHPHFFEERRGLLHWKCENSDYWDTVVHHLGTPISELEGDEESTEQMFRLAIGEEKHEVCLIRV